MYFYQKLYNMTTFAKDLRQISVEEYLRIDRQENREKNGKYEFFNQKLIYMAGGTLKHGAIATNTNGVFFMGLLKNRSINSVFSDTKIKSYLDYKNYVYPDGAVSDGRPEYEDEKKDILTNPLLIVEILSNSTEIFDRGEKFKSYRNIPTFKEYLLISQDKRCVEQFYKDENGQWQFGEVLSKGILKLKSMEVELNIDDIYFNVETPEIIEERD
jgi:Uma2 family endonuclease